MNRSVSHWLIRASRVICLAAAYFVLGRLGLLLALPPGYATAVWPPSGVALVGVLLFGTWIWPGVFLGSFLVNIGTSFDASTTASTLFSFVPPVLIATGASLQAVSGAFLVRRYVGFPTRLDREWEVVKFLALGGPVSCLVNATLSVTALTMLGLNPPGTSLLSWFTWWAGDSIGVLVVAPLALSVLGEPRAVWRKRVIPVGLPLAVAFSFVVVVIGVTSRLERRQMEHDFDARAASMTQSLQRGFDEYQAILTSIAETVDVLENVEASTLHSLMRQWIERRPGLRMLAWISPTSGTGTTAVEDFEPAEPDTPTPTAEVDPCGEPFAIVSMEPRSDSLSFRGTKVAADADWCDAMRRAAHSGLHAALDHPGFALPGRRPLDLIVLAPVREPPNEKNAVDDARIPPRGFVAGGFHLERVVQDWLGSSVISGIQVRVSSGAAADSTPADRETRNTQARSLLSRFIQGPTQRATRLSLSKSATLGDRRLNLSFSATPAFRSFNRTWLGGSVVAGGFIATGLLGAFLLVIAGRSSRIEALVTVRTADLSESNAALAREIAERKRAESRFRDLLASAPDAIVIVDAQGTIVLVNSQTEKLFGYSTGELIGKPVEMLVPTRRRKRHVEHRAAFMSDPRARPMGQSLELRGLRRDGTEFPVEISLSPLITEEGVLVSSAIRDITARKRVEEDARRHREELAHVSRLATMGALATGLAHELNQPLCAIATNAQAAQRMLSSPVPETDELSATLRDIAQGALRAGDIIQHLRDFVRKGSSSYSTLDLNRVVDEIRDFIEVLTTEHKATVRVELQEEPLPTLADRIQLQQVILNLVRNGLEAMSTAEAAERELVLRTARKPGGEVEVAVCDRGMGLSKTAVDRIFQPFFTTKANGMGVGLSISRSIIEAFGGRMEVTPNSDRGSTFHIILPAAKGGIR